MDIVGEFDGTGVNVGLRIPLTSDYRLNLGFTHIERLPSWKTRYWTGHPAFTIGFDMAVPRMGGSSRSLASGPSNQPLSTANLAFSNDGSVPAYMDSTIAMADFTVMSLRDSMLMMNNEMRNLMVQLSALEQESQFLVDSLKQLKLGKNVQEKNMDSIKNYFFKDGVQMVVDGYSLDEITEIMETRIEYREKRENVQKSMLKSMGDLAPAWGMVGTLIGLVLMLAGFGGEGGADNLGGGMAAALITTLYGAVFANLFFLPMADKMGNKTTQTSMSAALLVEAARLIHQKKHPLIVREKLNSFIPPGEWKTEG
jgi:chemotaxis protein MotA